MDQLRVHCAELGCPIVGDKIYGIPDDSSIMLLHAYQIQILLYPQKDPLLITAPLGDGWR